MTKIIGCSLETFLRKNERRSVSRDKLKIEYALIIERKLRTGKFTLSPTVHRDYNICKLLVA